MVDPLTTHAPAPASPDLPVPGSTARTRVRRIPEKAVNERAVLDAILDAGLVAHVAVVDASAGGQPYVVPVAYARDGDHVLFHGSTGSRLFRSLASGTPTCLTVTLLDGLVIARSAFESSMHYRSVMVIGSCEVVSGTSKRRALRTITEHLMPGRWDDVRPPHRKELAATTVLSLSLAEASAKVGAGQPEDPDDDIAGPAWAGILPLRERYGRPRAAKNLAPGIPMPEYVTTWTR